MTLDQIRNSVRELSRETYKIKKRIRIPYHIREADELSANNRDHSGKSRSNLCAFLVEM